MAKNQKELQERAEASFKHKEVQARDAKKAMVEYLAAGAAMREKTEKLRALRLRKEAADKEVADREASARGPVPAKAPPKKKPKRGGTRG